MTTQEKIEVMQAYAEGKKIEWRTIGSPKKWVEWTYSDEPSWNWVVNDYRIKPKPTYRPYKDTEEMIADFKKRFNAKVPPYAMPMIWVKRKDDSDIAKLITEFGYSCVWLSINPVGITMSKLFQDYAYLDGSPCGIKEE